MGVTVRQKSKGKGKPWWVFINHNGNRTSKLVGDKAAAQDVASKIRAKLQLGEFGFEKEKPDPIFKEYADSWIRTTVPATCKDSTVKDYQDLLWLHVLPVFANLELGGITRGKIKDFLLDKINCGYAKSTVSHMKDVVSGVLNKALDDEVIPVNPVYSLGRNVLKAKKQKKAIDPLSKEELKLLLDTVQVHFPEHYTLFLLLARTGMRIGEALALQWGDIDFVGRFISVERSLVRGRITTPKNGEDRPVDMSLQLAKRLKAHELESKKKGLALGLGDLPEYIFTNDNGNPIDKDNWRRRVFNNALKKAGLRIRIHDLRHTYATLRISKGDNIQDVSNQLGHSSTTLTLDVYSHWMPGKKKDEVDALDDDFMHPSAPPLHPEQSEDKKWANQNRLTH